MKKILEEINLQKYIIDNATQKVKDLELNIKEMLIEESGFELNKQYKYQGDNETVWIKDFILKKYSKKYETYKIYAITMKVKKDGTNGNQSHNSWGCDIDRLKSID